MIRNVENEETANLLSLERLTMLKNEYIRKEMHRRTESNGGVGIMVKREMFLREILFLS